MTETIIIMSAENFQHNLCTYIFSETGCIKQQKQFSVSQRKLYRSLPLISRTETKNDTREI